MINNLLVELQRQHLHQVNFSIVQSLEVRCLMRHKPSENHIDILITVPENQSGFSLPPF